MEKKKKWNFAAHASIADAFDKISGDDKGWNGSAACLLFVLAPPEIRKAVLLAVNQAGGISQFEKTPVLELAEQILKRNGLAVSEHAITYKEKPRLPERY